MQISLKPIGVVHTKASEDEVRSHSRVESVLELYPEFEPAMDGLEGFSHIFVIGYFHNLRPEQVGPLKVRPKRLVRFGIKLEDLPLVGVFALDSPTRPNPIGLSLAELKERNGRNLTVTGLDYFDGTPILDIKPYQTSYRADSFSLPEWRTKLVEKAQNI